MTGLIVWGGMGLLFGAAVQHCGFSTAEGVYHTVTLRRGSLVRTLLYTLGIGMALTAFLAYLAVIDVDLVEVLPLHSGTILGGILFGIAVGLAGVLPATALTGIGGGRLLEALSAAAGCVAGSYLAGVLPLDGLRSLFPAFEATLFRMRLDGPCLFAGGFLALACTGILICVAALFVPMEQAEPEPLPVPTPAPQPGEPRAADAFVALMPEEEPLVVDTAEHAADDELKALDDISLTVVTDEEIDLPKEEKRMRRKRKQPIMKDHPELETAPQEAAFMQRMEEAEEQAGILPPAEEADMPAGARALRSVTEAAADEPSPEDEHRR